MADKITLKDLEELKAGRLDLKDLRDKYRKGRYWYVDKRGTRSKDWSGKSVHYKSTSIRSWESKVEKGLIKPKPQFKRSPVTNPKETVGQVAERFKNTKRYKGVRTYSEITRNIKKLSPKLLNTLFADLTSEDFFDEYEYTKLNSQNNSPLQGKRAIKLIKAIYSTMSQSGESIVDPNLTALINDECKAYRAEMPRIEKVIHYWQVQKIFSSRSERRFD